MSVWYKVNYWREVSPVEVERETDLYLYIDGKRRRKTSEYENFFPTREEAVEYVIKRQKQRIAYLEMYIKNTQQELDEAKAVLLALKEASIPDE